MRSAKVVGDYVQFRAGVKYPARNSAFDEIPEETERHANAQLLIDLIPAEDILANRQTLIQLIRPPEDRLDKWLAAAIAHSEENPGQE